MFSHKTYRHKDEAMKEDYEKLEQLHQQLFTSVITVPTDAEIQQCRALAQKVLNSECGEKQKYQALANGILGKCEAHQGNPLEAAEYFIKAARLEYGYLNNKIWKNTLLSFYEAQWAQAATKEKFLQAMVDHTALWISVVSSEASFLSDAGFLDLFDRLSTSLYRTSFYLADASKQPKGTGNNRVNSPLINYHLLNLFIIALLLQIFLRPDNTIFTPQPGASKSKLMGEVRLGIFGIDEEGSVVDNICPEEQILIATHCFGKLSRLDIIEKLGSLIQRQPALFARAFFLLMKLKGCLALNFALPEIFQVLDGIIRLTPKQTRLHHEIYYRQFSSMVEEHLRTSDVTHLHAAVNLLLKISPLKLAAELADITDYLQSCLHEFENSVQTPEQQQKKQEVTAILQQAVENVFQQLVIGYDYPCYKSAADFLQQLLANFLEEIIPWQKLQLLCHHPVPFANTDLTLAEGIELRAHQDYLQTQFGTHIPADQANDNDCNDNANRMQSCSSLKAILTRWFLQAIFCRVDTIRRTLRIEHNHNTSGWFRPPSNQLLPGSLKKLDHKKLVGDDPKNRYTDAELEAIYDEHLNGEQNLFVRAIVAPQLALLFAQANEACKKIAECVAAKAKHFPEPSKNIFLGAEEVVIPPPRPASCPLP